MPAIQTPGTGRAGHPARAGNGARFSIHFPKRFTGWLYLLRHLPDRVRLAMRGADGSEAERHDERGHHASCDRLPPLVERYNARVGHTANCWPAMPSRRTSRTRSTMSLAAPRLIRIFRHMFATLEQPTFVIGNAWPVIAMRCCRWEFRFGLSGKSRIWCPAAQRSHLMTVAV